MYTIAYKFGRAMDIGEYIAGGHEIKMLMEFNINTSDPYQYIEKFAPDYGVGIKSWGRTSTERELDEQVITPTKYEFEVYDLEYELRNLIIEGSLVPYVNKSAKVTLEIKYYGDSTYTTEFIGYIDVQSIAYDPLRKIFSFTCFPQTDILKKTYFYDETNQDGIYDYLNPLQVTIGSIINDWIYANPIQVKELIHRIYKKVNPDVQLNWSHNWTFKGFNITEGEKEFNLDELYLTSEWLSCAFFSVDNIMRLETLYDLLNTFSFSFGILTGMLSHNIAFVKDINYFDANNIQQLGTVKSYKISNEYNDIEAVRITSRYYNRNFKSKPNSWIERISGANDPNDPIAPIKSIVPYNSTMKGQNIIDKDIPFYIYSRLLQQVYYSSFYGIYNSVNYPIISVNIPYTRYYNDLATSLAIFYYNLRNKNKSAIIFGRTVPSGINGDPGRIDTFVVEGIKYDYLKNITYADNGYQILSLIKNFDKNESEIRALYITEYFDSQELTPAEGLPKLNINILPGGYLRSYCFNAELKPEDINNGEVALMRMEKGYLLAKIIIRINEKFNNLTSITIEDNDGVLIPDERIVNEADNTVESFIYKEYATQQTIKAVMTKSDICTLGDADIIFEIKMR